MADHVSRTIETNQIGIHDKLALVVKKHFNHVFEKPVAEHSKQAFAQIIARIARDGRPFMLDACCGVGDSSRHFAAFNPDHLVIGIDKSLSRLTRERDGENPDNLLLVRMDLNDFYRMASQQGIQPARHYILYPNPWPKAAHLKRRWHGAPVFPHLVALGGHIELRSNWRLYLEEFQAALMFSGHESTLEKYAPDPSITPFETKYRDSGQDLWLLRAALS